MNMKMNTIRKILHSYNSRRNDLFESFYKKIINEFYWLLFNIPISHIVNTLPENFFIAMSCYKSRDVHFANNLPTHHTT